LFVTDVDWKDWAHPNCAVVSSDHIQGWRFGDAQFHKGQHVVIDPLEASEDGPLLWRGGILGGEVVIRQWKRCGGNLGLSWHGTGVLDRVLEEVCEEPACILLLQEDGSTGLDLSFATHIFLLEAVEDPALRNQIVSRAYRMGAKGSVEVQEVQVREVKGN
jgi:hypothetical protein